MRMPLNVEDAHEHEKLSRTLSEWEILEEECLLDGDARTEEDPYFSVRQLYIICARILLLNIEVTAHAKSEPIEQQVSSRISKAIDTLVEMLSGNDESWNFMLRWPLRVLSLTVETNYDKEVLCQSLEKIWKMSSCGDVKRSLHQIRSERG